MFEFKLFFILIMYSSLKNTNGLQIAEHVAHPSLVSNCSRTELICSLSNSNVDAVVSWTFHGENAARLPTAHVQRDYAEQRWRLIIDCTTIRHAGTYVCNAHAADRQEIFHRKEAVVQVYVPVQVNINQPLIKQSSRNSVLLQCDINGYPRIQVSWFKLQRNIPSSKANLNSLISPTNQNIPSEINSDGLLKIYQESIKNYEYKFQIVDNKKDSNALEGGPLEIKLQGNTFRYVQINGTVDLKFSIENRLLEQFDDSQMQSMLTIHRLDVDDAGLYVCRARNAYGNQSENGFKLIVLETPKLRLVNSEALNPRSIELKIAILHNNNAPIQQLIIVLRNNTVVHNMTENFDFSVNKTTQLDNNISKSFLMSEGDWIILDKIVLESDQAGNVIGGIIDNKYYLNKTNNYLSYSSLENSSLQTDKSFIAKPKQSSINKFELIEPNLIRYVINNLQPASNYLIQVLAENQVGKSAISPFTVGTMSDVPTRIKNVHILTRTNETLLYGWKRPVFDNGALILRYEVQLAHAHPENWLRNETKDVNLTNGGPPRNNYMYIFVNLKPGSIYFFRVRACNKIGCSEWSYPPLLGITQDGHADPPENVKIKCVSLNQQEKNYVDQDIQNSVHETITNNSGEQIIEKNLKNRRENLSDDDQALINEDGQSNEQNLLKDSYSSLAEPLKWPADNFIEKSNLVTEKHTINNKKISKRSFIVNKFYKVKNNKAKRAAFNDDLKLNKNLNKTNLSKVEEIKNYTYLNNFSESNIQGNNYQKDEEDNREFNNKNELLQSFVIIKWDPPIDPKGTVLGYNISLDGITRFKNENNKEITERFKSIYEIKNNSTREFTVKINSNTKYKVKICTINKAGCGQYSNFGIESQCDSAPSITKNRFDNIQPILSRRVSNTINNFPHISAESTNKNSEKINDFYDSLVNKKNNVGSLNTKNSPMQFSTSNQLVLNLPRISEREGRILCYRIIIIRLPNFENLRSIIRKKNYSLPINNEILNKENLKNLQIESNVSKKNNNENSISLNENFTKKFDISQDIFSQINLLNESQLLEPSTEKNSKINSAYIKNSWLKFQTNSYNRSSSTALDFKNLNEANDNFDILSILPRNPTDLEVYRYENLKKQNLKDDFDFFFKSNNDTKKKIDQSDTYFAYLAKEMSSSDFQNEIIIGDNTDSSCSSECISSDKYLIPDDSLYDKEFDFKKNDKSKLSKSVKIINENKDSHLTVKNYPVSSAFSSSNKRCVYNGELKPDTNYTGFIEIHVAGINGTRLIQRSGYFSPISTGSQPITKISTATQFTHQLDKLSSILGLMNDNTTAIVFGTISGFTSVLLLFLVFILCCLKRKITSNRNQSESNESNYVNSAKKSFVSNTKMLKKSNENNVTKQVLKYCVKEDHCLAKNEINDQFINDQILSKNSLIENNSFNNIQPAKSVQLLNESMLTYIENQQNLNNAQSTFCNYSYLENNENQLLEKKPLNLSTAQTILIETNNQHILPLNENIQLIQLDQSNTNFYQTDTINNLIGVNDQVTYDQNMINCENYCNNVLPLNEQKINIQNNIDNNYSQCFKNNFNKTLEKLANDQTEVLTAHKWIITEFPMINIHEVFMERHENDDQLFKLEYSLLPIEFEDRTFIASSNSFNSIKNRHSDNKCFDQTRIKLGLKTVSFSHTISTMPRKSSNTSNSYTSSLSSFGTLRKTLRKKKTNNESKKKKINEEIKNQESSYFVDSSNSPSISNNLQINDYIHANQIILNETIYICTQAPLENTIKDFWQMVLEQNVQIIVALCNLEEDCLNVCASYWNELDVNNGLKQLGDMRVQLVSNRKYSDYIIRRFCLTKRISNAGGSKGNQQIRLSSNENEICREIIQFQFLKWQEYANLGEQPSWLLCFIERINEYINENSMNKILSGPLLVHCTDGCGRTGTFLAVRALMSQINLKKYQEKFNEQNNSQVVLKESTLNIFDYVSQLRYQRYMLVDSIDQYIFIYRAILEYVKFGNTQLDGLCNDYVEQHIKNNSVLDFQVANSNQLSFILNANSANNIVGINYHNVTQSVAESRNILPEFDV